MDFFFAKSVLYLDFISSFSLDVTFWWDEWFSTAKDKLILEMKFNFLFSFAFWTLRPVESRQSPPSNRIKEICLEIKCESEHIWIKFEDFLQNAETLQIETKPVGDEIVVLVSDWQQHDPFSSSINRSFRHVWGDLLLSWCSLQEGMIIHLDSLCKRP